MPARPSRAPRSVVALLVLALAGALVVPPATAPASAEAPVVRSTATACPPVDVPVAGYDDVEGHLFAVAVDCLSARGLVRGTSADRYSPEATLTRGQTALLLARLLRAAGVAVAPGERTFRDLDGVMAETREAVEGLAELGVVTGRGDVYGPGEPVLRDQTASVLARAVGVLGLPVPEPADCFDDLGGNVHAESVEEMCAAGVVAGVAPRRYDGRRPLTRAQFAGVLARVVDLLVADGRLPALPPVAYSGEASDVTAERLGSSWRPGCPVGPESLVLLRLTHRGFDGRARTGELVVARKHAPSVVRAFGEMFDAGFPVRRMETVDRFGSDDDASMAADNTSAFNCRRTTGGSSWSEHSYGSAVDVNPVENPYVRGTTVLPPAGRAYTDRRDVRPGMLVEGSAPVRAFDAVGWVWGGRWSSLKDYQHVSASGG